MKKLGLILVILVAVTLASCAAGPHQLYRTVDDWDHEMYVESPWLNAVLYIVPVFPILKYVALIGDFLVVDAWTFWTQDAWDGAGTGFKHYEVASDMQLSSLLNDDGKFLSAVQ